MAVDPRQSAAQVALARARLAAGAPVEALGAVERLAVQSDADIHVLSVYGDALKAVGRLDEAIAASRRAVAVAPASGVAEHNLAAMLGDKQQFAEAETAARRAFGKGLDAPETWLVLARAFQGQDRFDEAARSFREVLRRRPDAADAHGDLAQLIWMRTADTAAATAPLDQALRAYPRDGRLWEKKARILEYAGDMAGAYAVAVEGLAAGGSNPALEVMAAHLAATADPSRALDHARRAVALAPGDPGSLTALCMADLALGRADDAAKIAERLHEQAPVQQQPLALLAIAWRMMADPRYRQLYDYARLVRPSPIDTPPGWSRLDDFLADVAECLHRRHALRAHPVGQSLRGGTQTQQRLDQSDDPVIRALVTAIDGPVRRYVAALGPGDDPLRRRATAGYRIAGMWSVRLRPNGFHVDHIHPQGWLSSACYLALPAAIDSGREGWIKFGEPGVATHPRLPAEHYVKPEPGMIVLFPSYMWHGTVPFSGDDTRTSAALDIVPA